MNISNYMESKLKITRIKSTPTKTVVLLISNLLV